MQHHLKNNLFSNINNRLIFHYFTFEIGDLYRIIKLNKISKILFLVCKIII